MSEKSRANLRRSIKARTLVVSLVVSAGSMLARESLANPSGSQVAAGTVTVSSTGSTLNVNQASERAVINWQSFSIAPGETTNFLQPNTTAITLNRVTGIDPSQILGNLNANGQVWLINPNGVVFGKSARVDVAGLLATTVDIADKDFLAGNYRFSGLGNPSAMVSNAGQITIKDAGLAALVAPGVENSGVIQANLGQIQLSSANAFTIDFYGDGLFNFSLDQQVTQQIQKADGTHPSAAVSNSGDLIANGGRIFLTANVARSVVDSAINMNGIAQATSASESNGEIMLDGGAEGTVQVAGTLDASGNGSGATGGKVEVLGDAIRLASTARIDATGPAGGGKVLIGGDFLDGEPNPQLQSQFGITLENAPVRTASSVTIDQGAVVNASATDRGPGGRIAVWSNNATTVKGSLYAHGGPKGGDGGFVETSSHGAVDVANADVFVGSTSGSKWGSWLVDPTYTITAQSGFVDTGITNVPGDLLIIFVTGGLGADQDDGGVPDPFEQEEFDFPQFPPYSLVATIGGGSPFVLSAGPHFFSAQGDLEIALNKEDFGPPGAFQVTVERISSGSIAQIGQNQNQLLGQVASAFSAWSTLGGAVISGLEQAIDAMLEAIGLVPTTPTVPPPPKQPVSYPTNPSPAFPLGYQIDYSFIQSHEGDVLSGYVPKDQSGQPAGMSGVTIATGIDLGQWTAAQFLQLGVNPSLVDELSGYFGLKKQSAVDYLAQHPLTITAAEAGQLDLCIGRSIVSTLANDFNHDQSFTTFAALPPQAQTAIADLAYQYGPNLAARPQTAAFWNDVTNGNWSAAEAQLLNFGDAYPARRTSEAQQLEVAIQAGTLPTPPKS